MSLVLEEPLGGPGSAAPVCAVDGMPLYETIVGPRCPLCGAAALR